MKKLNEFQDDGNLPSIVQKISNVIGRKIGYEINMSGFPFDKKGLYAFFGGINQGKLGFISLNFDGGDIVSVTLYDDPVDLVSVAEIELQGYNIVQVIDEIAEIVTEFITGKDIFEMQLEERGRNPKATSIFSQWLDSGKGNMKLVTNERLTAVYRDFFSDWASANRISLSVTAFIQQAKEFLADNKLENKYARKVLVMKGGDQLTFIEPPTAEERDWENAKAESYESAFRQIDVTIPLIARGTYNSAYIFGTPGSGKSTRVEQILNDLNISHLTVKGGYHNTEDFVSMLYFAGGAEPIFDENDKIVDVTPNPDTVDVIVLDDFSVSKEERDIILACTDDKKVRIVSYKSAKLQNQPKKRAVPSRFIFNSSLICISNSEKIDKAIADRAIAIPVILSKTDMLEAIVKNLEDFMPSLELKIKEEVLQWFIESFGELNRISFRQFKIATMSYLACGGALEWKTFAKRSINAF